MQKKDLVPHSSEDLEREVLAQFEHLVSSDEVAEPRERYDWQFIPFCK